MKKRIIIGTALTIMLAAMMTGTRSCGGGGYNNEKENEVVEELSQEDTNLEELEQE
jgi:hypothetical protein